MTCFHCYSIIEMFVLMKCGHSSTAGSLSFRVYSVVGVYSVLHVLNKLVSYSALSTTFNIYLEDQKIVLNIQSFMKLKNSVWFKSKATGKTIKLINTQELKASFIIHGYINIFVYFPGYFSAI